MLQTEDSPSSEMSQIAMDNQTKNGGDQAPCTSSDCPSNRSESSEDSRGRLSALENELQARTRDLERLKFKIDKMKSQSSGVSTPRRDTKPINIRIELERLKKDKKVMAELLKQSQQEIARKESVNKKLKQENDKLNRTLSSLRTKLTENGRNKHLLEQLEKVRNEISLLTSKSERLDHYGEGQENHEQSRVIEDLIVEKEQLKQCLSAIYLKITPYAVSLPYRDTPSPVWTEDVRNTFEQFCQEKMKLERELQHLRLRVKSRNDSPEDNKNIQDNYETTISECSTDSRADCDIPMNISDDPERNLFPINDNQDSEVCKWKELYQVICDKYRSAERSLLENEKQLDCIRSSLENTVRQFLGEETNFSKLSSDNVVKVINRLSEECTHLKDSLKKIKKEEENQVYLQNCILDAEKTLQKEGRTTTTLKTVIGDLNMASNMESKFASLAETMLQIYTNQLEWVKQLEHNNAQSISEGEDAHSTTPPVNSDKQSDEELDNNHIDQSTKELNGNETKNEEESTIDSISQPEVKEEIIQTSSVSENNQMPEGKTEKETENHDTEVVEDAILVQEQTELENKPAESVAEEAKSEKEVNDNDDLKSKEEKEENITEEQPSVDVEVTDDDLEINNEEKEIADNNKTSEIQIQNEESTESQNENESRQETQTETAQEIQNENEDSHEAQTENTDANEGQTENTEADEGQTENDDANEGQNENTEANEGQTENDDANEGQTENDDANEGQTENTEANEGQTENDDINEGQTENDDANEGQTENDDANEGQTENIEANVDLIENDGANEGQSENIEASENQTENDDANEGQTENDDANESQTENSNVNEDQTENDDANDNQNENAHEDQNVNEDIQEAQTENENTEEQIKNEDTGEEQIENENVQETQTENDDVTETQTENEDIHESQTENDVNEKQTENEVRDTEIEKEISQEVCAENGDCQTTGDQSVQNEDDENVLQRAEVQDENIEDVIEKKEVSEINSSNLTEKDQESTETQQNEENEEENKADMENEEDPKDISTSDLKNESVENTDINEITDKENDDVEKETVEETDDVEDSNLIKADDLEDSLKEDNLKESEEESKKESEESTDDLKNENPDEIETDEKDEEIAKEIENEFESQPLKEATEDSEKERNGSNEIVSAEIHSENLQSETVEKNSENSERNENEVEELGHEDSNLNEAESEQNLKQTSLEETECSTENITTETTKDETKDLQKENIELTEETNEEENKSDLKIDEDCKNDDNEIVDKDETVELDKKDLTKASSEEKEGQEDQEKSDTEADILSEIKSEDDIINLDKQETENISSSNQEDQNQIINENDEKSATDDLESKDEIEQTIENNQSTSKNDLEEIEKEHTCNSEIKEENIDCNSQSEDVPKILECDADCSLQTNKSSENENLILDDNKLDDTKFLFGNDVKIVINSASSEVSESTDEQLSISALPPNLDQDNPEMEDIIDELASPVVEPIITKETVERKDNVFFATPLEEETPKSEKLKDSESNEEKFTKRIEELETEMMEMQEVRQHHMQVACELAEQLESMKKRESELREQLAAVEKNSSLEVEGMYKEWSGREQSYQDEIAAWKENVQQQNSVLQRLKADLDQAQQMVQQKENEIAQLRGEKELLESETQTSDQEDAANSKELKATVERLRKSSEHYQQQLLENRTVVREVKSIIEGSVAQLVTLKAMGTKHMKREYVYRSNLAQKEQDLKHLQQELDRQTIDARSKGNIIEKQRQEIRLLKEELRKYQNDISAKVEFIDELQAKVQNLMMSEVKEINIKPNFREMFSVGERCLEEQHLLHLEKQKDDLRRLQERVLQLEAKFRESDSAGEASDHAQSTRSHPGSAGSVDSLSESDNLCLCKRKDYNKILKMSEESYLNLLTSLIVCLGISDLKYNKSLLHLNWSQCKDVMSERKSNQKKIIKFIQILKNEERKFSPRPIHSNRVRCSEESESRKIIPKPITPPNGQSTYISDMIRHAEDNLDKERLVVKGDAKKFTPWRPVTSNAERRIPLELKNGEILALLGSSDPKSVPKSALNSK